MSEAEDTILSLKRDFVCEVLELSFVHATWTAKALQVGDDKQALACFERFVTAVRSAADEMKAIRTAGESQSLTAAAAESFRANRDGAAPKQRAA